MICSSLYTHITGLQLTFLTAVQDRPYRSFENYSKVDALSAMHEVDSVACHDLCRNGREVNGATCYTFFGREWQFFAM